MGGNTDVLPPLDAEWLETDGLGGFASGTVNGIRTRRYHALFMPAVRPPEGRAALVDGFDAWIDQPGRAPEFLSRQSYEPGVVAGRQDGVLVGCSVAPWPVWRFRLATGIELEQELFLVHESAIVAVRWRVVQGSTNGLSLKIRPFLSGRESHALIREPQPPVAEAIDRGCVVRLPVAEGYPEVISLSNGEWHSQPERYRQFRYDEELARGFDHVADLAAPGFLTFDLGHGEAVWLLSADRLPGHQRLLEAEPGPLYHELRAGESRRRAAFPDRLTRSADQYLVRRGAGKTIIAGYPWFTDWGRDTFIAVRGLCLATGRLDDARQILLQWAGTVDRGQVPNRFVEAGGQPEFNAVDASLWYVIAAHEYLLARGAAGMAVSPNEEGALRAAIEAILEGYASGTRFGIAADTDGLLRAGEPGVQLTWMDARIGDWVVTPRIGKPVEVQALWLNALRIGGASSPRWLALYELGLRSFGQRFWDESHQRLYDVVDSDHVAGKLDASLRPNQILAIGGLPFPLLEGPRARAVVDAVEQSLLTPLGLRSLGPEESDFAPRYEGGPRERDAAYHQGTVWPWLLGPFVDAWIAVRGNTDAAKNSARQQFLAPLLAHLDQAGLNHIAEIADAVASFTPRGCPFQAWSVGEALRLDRVVLAPSRPVKADRRARRVAP